MNKYVVLPFLCLMNISVMLYGQEAMEVEGAIRIGNTSTQSPELGTIRWNGTDFVGWNGITWISLTGGAKVGTVTDVDLNVYKTIVIGNREWMAENLRTTRYSDNSPIPLAGNAALWMSVSSSQTPAYCWYGDNRAMYEDPYGALYNWYALSTSTNGNKNVCPDGWVVPSLDDYEELVAYLGEQYNAGGKMKADGTNFWASPNKGADNSSGFSGLPGGYRSFSDGLFNFLGDIGVWWSVGPSNSAYEVELYYDQEYILLNSAGGAFNGFGFSVRCIR